MIKVFSEFVIMQEAKTLPEVKTFCKSIWESSNFDSEGDFYYDGINNEWTTLDLEDRVDSTKFRLRIWREKKHYPPTIDIIRLESYLKFYKNGEYSWVKELNEIQSLMITSISIETSSMEKLEDFTKTCRDYLKYSQGVIVNTGDIMNLNEFIDKYFDRS